MHAAPALVARTPLDVAPRVRDLALEVDGFTTRVLVVGRGPPLVLVPSPLIEARAYRPTLRALAPSFSVVAADLPGSGRAARLSTPWDVERCARFCLALLDTLGLARAIVVGHSNSGAIALRMARLVPARVLRLVLADTIGVRAPPRPLRTFAGRLVDGLLEPLLSLRGWPYLVRNALVHTRSFAAHVRVSLELDLRDEVRDVDVPTLVAAARHDHAMPIDDARRFAARARRAVFTELPGSHDACITRAAAFARVVSAFAARA